jgi:hypothetical protein
VPLNLDIPVKASTGILHLLCIKRHCKIAGAADMEWWVSRLETEGGSTALCNMQLFVMAAPLLFHDERGQIFLERNKR